MDILLWERKDPNSMYTVAGFTQESLALVGVKSEIRPIKRPRGIIRPWLLARSLNYPDSIAIEPSLAVVSKLSYFFHYDPTDNKAIPSLIELWDIWRHVASKPVICFSWQAFRFLIDMGATPTLLPPPWHPVPQNPNKDLDWLWIGSTSYRKGYDLMTKLYKAIGGRGVAVVRDTGQIPYVEWDGVETYKYPIAPAKLQELQSRAKVYIQTSRLEGYGMTVSEAYCHGAALVIPNEGYEYYPGAYLYDNPYMIPTLARKAIRDYAYRPPSESLMALHSPIRYGEKLRSILEEKVVGS